ncbi:nucleoside hydrolase [Dacryopinax primogenitus]|uniref:Nucleoside hydrolase n=1 Tax=Dacryopinax primogenitus (strain DJM 731) TaxID=1858805 RepID=M5G9L2_DACPD|nr:nucleoside hydrolase [Dacryopinax primogenitus]EJU04960.1 nucleoside hydrolase [Dacryopinax primogenitus]
MLALTFLHAVAAALLPAAVNAACGKVIIDNDWSGSSSYTPLLELLGANCTILGITSTVANVYAYQGARHILRFLEIAGIDYIPVYVGANEPLINTVERSAAWQAVFGAFTWDGAFSPDNATLDAQGGDPTGNNPLELTNIPEGVPTMKWQNQSAVDFMIEMAHQYPGQVEIVAAGAMTTVALAIKQDPYFASNIKRISIQGGYVDVNLKQTDPTPANQTFPNDDVYADFNFFIDPEAAKIVVNAPFQETVIAGQVSIPYLVTPAIFNETISMVTPITQNLSTYWASSIGTPLWDEIAAGVIAYPEIVTKSRVVYMDVDVAYDSIFYGRTFVAVAPFQPVNSRNVTFVEQINFSSFLSSFIPALQGNYATRRV